MTFIYEQQPLDARRDTPDTTMPAEDVASENATDTEVPLPREFWERFTISQDRRDALHQQLTTAGATPDLATARGAVSDTNNWSQLLMCEGAQFDETTGVITSDQGGHAREGAVRALPRVRSSSATSVSAAAWAKRTIGGSFARDSSVPSLRAALGALDEFVDVVERLSAGATSAGRNAWIMRTVVL